MTDGRPRTTIHGLTCVLNAHVTRENQNGYNLREKRQYLLAQVHIKRAWPGRVEQFNFVRRSASSARILHTEERDGRELNTRSGVHFFRASLFNLFMERDTSALRADLLTQAGACASSTRPNPVMNLSRGSSLLSCTTNSPIRTWLS